MQRDMTRDQSGGSTPVPDPTVLTTEALQREILALRQLLELRVTALREMLQQSVDDLHRLMASELEVQSVRCEQQFEKVGLQLQLVEQQRIEQKADTKAAVDAALTAQKEAVSEQTTASERSIAKSETATTKSIEQLGATFNTANDGMRRDIDGLKERIVVAESLKVGGREAVVTRQQGALSANAIVGTVIGAAGVIAAIIAVAVR